jgi:hypothetical protein
MHYKYLQKKASTHPARYSARRMQVLKGRATQPHSPKCKLQLGASRAPTSEVMNEPYGAWAYQLGAASTSQPTKEKNESHVRK